MPTKKHHSFNTHKGFSLVEVLVAAALAAGLVVVVMQVNKMMAKAEKKGLAAYDMIDTMVELRSKLKIEDYCLANFKNRDGKDFKVKTLRNQKGHIDFSDNRKIGSSQINIASFHLTDKNDLNYKTEVKSNDWGTTELLVTFHHRDIGKKVRSLKVNVFTDGGGNIERCYAGEPYHSGTGKSSLPAKMQVIKNETNICRFSSKSELKDHCDIKCKDFGYHNSIVDTCKHADLLICMCVN